MSDDAILLFELTGYTDASTSNVYRWANRPYRTTPADTPANTDYEPLVVDTCWMRRQLWADGQSGVQAQPKAEVNWGAATFRNTHRALDPIFGATSGISFRERPFRLLAVQPDAPYSSAQVLLRATIGQAALTRRLVTVSLKDRSYELDSPHTTVVYAGTNSLPNGLEGVADLAGKVKPLVYGKVLQIAAPCVNTSRNIYQLSTRAIQSAKAYDGGNLRSAGADYTSQADMETNAPSAGQVRVWPAGGCIRWDAAPTFQATYDVVGDTAGNSTAAQIIQRLALDRGISSGDISAADITALDAANSAVCGVLIDDNRSTLAAMAEMALSVGASFWFDGTGVLRLKRFDGVPGTPVAVAALWNCAALEQIASDEDVPTLDVRLQYARYRRPLSTSELAGISLASAADLAQEWRTSPATSTLSPNPYKRTKSATRQTALVNKADADTEAARLLALFGTPRRTHVATGTRLSAAELAALDLNSTVELRGNTFGFDEVAGTPRIVTAMTTYYGAQRVDLTLWGT